MRRGKMQPTTRSVQQTTNFQTTCGMQRAICSGQQTTCTAQQATCARLPATCSGQQRHATQHAACNGQRAACNTQRGICERPLTTGKKAAGNKVTCGMQQTPRRRRQDQATHATDNVHQTADHMQEHASICEMQPETHGIATFRVRRVAGSAQPAACAKHCTRQPVRNTAQTPHTRCNTRPGPQHPANTRGTDNTQQEMQCTG